MWFQCTRVFLSSVFVTYARVDCPTLSPLPIQVPIRNITLPNLLVYRGAAFSIGTPAQSLAFGLSPYTFPLPDSVSPLKYTNRYKTV